jgi:hypothetical protein
MEWTRAEVWARLLELQNFVPADCKLSPHEVALDRWEPRVSHRRGFWISAAVGIQFPASLATRDSRGQKIAKSEILSGHPLASIPR